MERVGENRVARGTMFFLILWVLQTNAYFGPSATWSSMSRFALTHSIMHDGTLRIDRVADMAGDRSFRDGHYYSDKSPVPALLAVPGYAVVRAIHHLRGRGEPSYTSETIDGVVAARVTLNREARQLFYACSVVASGLCGALAAALLFSLLTRRFPARIALFATTLIVLGTPWFAYATSLYGHVPALLFLLLAATLLDRPAQRWHAPVIGSSLALAVGCEMLTALPGAIVGLWACAAARRRGELGRFVLAALAGALPVVVLLGAYNTYCFGAPWRTGYSHLTSAEFTAGHSRGFMGISAPSLDALWGLTFGTRRGLFYLAPITLLGVVGVLRYLRDSRDETARMLALSLLAMFLANAGYYMWWGGASTGPRHLVPVLPVLAWGIAWALSDARLRALAWLLGAVSIANMLAFVAVGIEAPERGETLLRYAWGGVLEGRIAHLSSASNLGLQLGLPRLASVVPLLLWWIFGLRYLSDELESVETQPREELA